MSLVPQLNPCPQSLEVEEPATITLHTKCTMHLHERMALECVTSKELTAARLGLEKGSRLDHSKTLAVWLGESHGDARALAS